MTLAARLPDDAPFGAEAIAQLNRVIGQSTPAQRHWLAGFLAGLEAAAQAPAAPVARPKLTILYATESGNAEALAMGAKRDASRLGFAVRLLDAADARPAALVDAGSLLVIASTWGEGDAPQRAARFVDALLAEDAPALPGVKYAVLALGDRAYAQFCATGRAIDERLAALGAVRVAERVECDLDYAAPAAALPELRGAPVEAAGADVIHVDFGAGPVGRAEVAAEIGALVTLNSSRSTKQTMHVELLTPGIAYEPGDSLGLVPHNDAALVEAVLGAAGVAADAALEEALTRRHDLTTLSAHLVRQVAEASGSSALGRLVADGDALAAYVPGRQVLDLLTDHEVRLTSEQLRQVLRPLAPRLYSIASSLRVTPDEAHLLVGAVRYQAHGRARAGVASTWIADRLGVGDRLDVHVKANRQFRLPADPSAPIVMIGAGTGVAPYRAFLQEREAVGGAGPSWLVFGDRTYTHDFLYQLDWQEFIAAGVLTRMDVAFSRDQPEKRYVQHALLERGAELYAWLRDGAHVYVCGDRAGMARDVEAALLAILTRHGDGAAELDALREAGRYRLDVY